MVILRERVADVSKGTEIFGFGSVHKVLAGFLGEEGLGETIQKLQEEGTDGLRVGGEGREGLHSPGIIGGNDVSNFIGVSFLAEEGLVEVGGQKLERFLNHIGDVTTSLTFHQLLQGASSDDAVGRRHMFYVQEKKKTPSSELEKRKQKKLQ